MPRYRFVLGTPFHSHWFIILIWFTVICFHRASAGNEVFVAPTSPRQIIDFDSDWKFIREDVPGAEATEFADSKWSLVSTPHTFNDVDTFNKIISHSEGQKGQYLGVAWYRKHFWLPRGIARNKLILEFEGLRQSADIFLNGKAVGLYENGITSYGIDITNAVHVDGKENVLAVKVNNSTRYVERATNTAFEWEAKDFNPDYGGIHKHVWLHVLGKIYQTLPVYCGLETSGVCIYASNFGIAGRIADVNVEAQVNNASNDQTLVTLSAVVVDSDGKVAAKFDGDTVDMVAGEKTIVKASGRLNNARWWCPDKPNLYTVYTLVTVDNKVVDVVCTLTGFRKVDFRGGAGKGGVYINDQFTYLKGYAQRSTNEWAGLGQAYPDWMHDLTAKLIRDSHANYVRWMHIAPQPVDVAAFDRLGIVEVCPAGDKEKDVTGRQWDQRVEVMRDTIIAYRNSPSILFWEAGNNHITAEHLKQMVDLKAEFDPNGGRAMGCRSLDDPDTTPMAEYFGVMIGQDDQKDKRKGPSDLFRAYSDQRRDRSPIIEMEDFRDEAARRFWDDFSPPHFGFKPGPNDTYHWNSETFCLAAAERYWAYWSNRICNTDAAHAKWSGYASIYFSDSNADGRQDSSEVCRVSGKVDAVRLPKEAWYTYRVMQNPQPDLHIIGHWTYPAGTQKTVFVVSNCDAVRLSLNGKTLGELKRPPQDNYIFAFPNISFSAGSLTAIGLNSGDQACEESLQTAGAAKSIRLTAITAPGGIHADGADVALVDVEVVDATGKRCPTDEARIDFDLTGPAIWRGGYNSGIVDSTNNHYLSTECGINRIAIRSTTTSGTIVLTAQSVGVTSATLWLHSQVARGEFPPIRP